MAAQSTVTLSTPTSPSAGQPGVQVITLTGSNFPAGTIQPADITVTLRPATSAAGAVGSTPAATIATLIGTSRRLTFTIPTTIAVVSPVAYLVSIAGHTTTGIAFASANAASITVNPPPQITSVLPASSNPGTSVAVAITTTLTNFVQGATQANFGAGVSVGGGPVGGFGPVTVASPTSATAQLTIAATAAPGPATVTVKTGVQTATLTGAFSIVTPPPTNHAPVVSAGAAQTITLPAGATLAGAVSDDGLPSGATLTSNWTAFSGPGAVAFGNASSPGTTATFDQAGTYVLRLTASDSQLTSHDDTTVIVLPRPNRPPAITSAPSLTATASQPYSYQVAATDPDGDAIAWRLVTAPAGMTIDSLGAIAWTPGHDQVGAQAVVIEASDGLGGTDRQSYSVAVAPAVTLSSIDATPEIIRFSELGAARAITVTGLNSDGSTLDLTHATETTYTSSSPFVASVDADGTVHAVASGAATITVRNGQFADTAAVVIEPGITLDSLDLTPTNTTLRTVGGSVAMTLRGHFSDGEARDLTTADGTVYTSSASGVATIDGSGRVTAVGVGDAAITARYDVSSATAVVHVFVSSGTGFFRGQVLDDSTGLPLGAADVQLIADGGGPLAPPVTATADDHGRFVLSGRAGDAVVRVTKAGFTSVERVATIPGDAALTLLDVRLTRINSRANLVASVFGGTASDAAGVLTLSVAPGALPTNADLRLTSVSGQGLQGRLPFGWSPVGAVDVGPAGLVFAQPASLSVPNAANLAPGTAVVVASYDAVRHQWIVSGTSQVGVDGRSIPISAGGTGQIVCVVADAAPFTPPVSTMGDALAGSSAVTLPADVSATGQVVPRSAPPGDQARAVGSVLLQSTTALPSGTVVQASVSERFDLTDQTQIVPRSFTEDLVLYARGRPSGDGILGATFPITPSRNLSIQELLHGVISLDVGSPVADIAATVVGAAGAVAVNAAGDSFQVPAGALTADTVVDIQRVSAAQTVIATPSGFDLLATIDLDLVGVTLAQPGRLSIGAPPDVGTGDQVLLAMVVEDPAGALRLRLIGTATLQSGRLLSQTTIGALNLPGPTSGGQYVFLRAQQPVGFITGRVLGVDGATPHSQALVTSDTAPFADISSGSGAFIVAGRAGADATVRAFDAVTSDVGTDASHVAAANQVVAADVALVATLPRITASIPSANATNVALDTSVSVDFSSAIDPASVTPSNASLQAIGGAVAGQLTLSADRKRLVFVPGAPLLGKTAYTLTVAGLRTASGRALTGGTTVSFTTVDPSKPTLGQSGLITGDLPDEDGLVLVTGNAGAAEAASPVTATNLTTQATTTVLAATDGSFRVRVAASIGDGIALTLSDATGRSTTISLAQLRSADGTTSVSTQGGTIAGAQGRVGTILPRALTQAGLFRLDAASGNAALPSLPDGFTYADQFHFSAQAAQFNTLASFSLTESQNRFAPQSPTVAPFAASGELTVPADFLVNASLHFTALALDASGVRRTAAAATLVVSGNAQTAAVEGSQSADFPTVFVSSPAQALQSQLVDVHAVAPAARVDLELPAPAGIDPSATLLLVRSESIGGETRLSIVDTLTSFVRNGTTLLHTSGRELPGMSVTGDYAVVASRDPLVFVTGRLTGAASVASLDGSPFVFDTGGPNGSFALPTAAGQPFAIHYADAVSGAVLGTSTGQAPTGGSADLGQPLAPPSARLTVSVDPDDRAIVDINQPLTFHFSEPVDARTFSSGIVVTDNAGLRVLGTATVGSDSTTGTFKPARRWRLGTTYRWGVATSVVAISGARLAQQASGAFTTFAPRVVSTTAVGTTNDVAVAGPLAAVATDSGLAAVDVSSLVAPVVQAQAPIAGGAHGVALMPGATFTDRIGQAHSGTFAAVGAGDTSGPGRLEVFDLSAATAPIDIGSSQLTSAGGAPNGVAITADQRALVPVQGTGVFSVHLPDAVPADPANPTHGLGPRYPASALEGVNQTAIVGDRVVAVGAAGLTVLDATTLARRGGVSTTGDARGVAVLPAFSMDLNGDGVIAANETFDLAVVANGSDGTLQFFNVPSSGDPVLLSVVHFTGETTGVALDATERIAYVGLGSRGLAFVDLDGPANVQPIDLDRNGVDDRILGTVDTPGATGRLALALDRGVGFLADGAAGVTVAQVLPARSRFTSLRRDPVLGHTGDEESVFDTLTAFTTDDALIVGVSAIVPEGSSLALVLNEQPDAGSSQVVTFDNGTTVAPLVSGGNQLVAHIGRGSHGAKLTLRVQDDDGRSLAVLNVRIAPPDSGGATLTEIFLAPSDGTLDSNTRTVQLEVGGLYSNHRVLNLTDPSSGTTYASDDEHVVTVDAGGVATAIAGGDANIGAQNGNALGFASVHVNLAPVLVSFDVARPFMTLRQAGSVVALPVVGVMSDATTRELSELTGNQFSVSDPAVVSISVSGDVTALANGQAAATVQNGSVTASIAVAVDLTTPAVISAVNLDPFPNAITADASNVAADAHVSGTGSLDGLIVTFAVSGTTTASFDAPTNTIGEAAGRFGDLPAGSYTVTVSVTDPASGQIRTDSKALLVQAGTGDNEPNNDTTSSSPLAVGRSTGGSVSAGTDDRDTYEVSTATDGTVNVSLQLADDASAANVVLVIRAADGTELQRITPTSSLTQTTLSVAAGSVFVSIEAVNGQATYQLAADYDQADVVISNVAPAAGGPGTTVVVSGTGFSARASDDVVTFAGIAGRLVSATPTQLVVLVPANTVNGPIEVVVGGRSATGPLFNVGNTAPPPQAGVQPRRSATAREDPASGLTVDITRLRVAFDPLVTAAQVGVLAQNLGGAVVGVIPSINSYVLEFAANATFDGLAALMRQLAAAPGVVNVARNIIYESDRAIDERDRLARWPGSKATLGAVWQQINLFDAIDAVRSTPPFHDRAQMKDVRVAVIDDGFAPNVPAEFRGPNGASVVTVFEPFLVGGSWTWLGAPNIGFGSHGTGVTSIIGAVNDGTLVNGAMNGFVSPGEQPFDVRVYINQSGGGIDDDIAIAALDRIRQSGDVDVVNMSFGANCRGDASCLASNLNDYRRVIQQMSGRTLVVMAAGNDAVTADSNTPSVLAMEPALTNVMSIGATAVANVDRTGEGADRRAVFPTPRHAFRGNTLCKASLSKKGSNCSPGITLAAPGEDYYVVSAFGRANYQYFNGTSSAAPTVASIAAILQSIRGSNQILPPSRLRQILVETADDISDLDSSWTPGRTQLGNLPGPPVKRLNALAAVEALLPPSSSQRIYVADEGIDADAGHLIGLDVNPLTGALTNGATDAVLDLVLHVPTPTGVVDVKFDRPSTIAMSPTGGFAYVIAHGPPSVGDALLIVNTRDLTVEDGVALGESIALPRPGLALSKDGRLAYIANGASLIVVNTVNKQVVGSFDDLPPPYNTLASDFGVTEFRTRMTSVRTLAAQAGPNLSFTGVRVSPDGTTLYVTIQAGGGSGNQPGIVIPLNIDLYEDADPTTSLIEPDLSKFLTPAFATQPVLKMSAAGTPEGGDEPSDVGVSPDGRFLYLTNGGLASFISVSADINSSFAFDDLTRSATAGLIDQPTITEQQIRKDFQLVAASGVTLLDAPGYTGVFSLDPNQATEAGKFPSEIVFGWNPGFEDGGAVVNQARFRDVYAKRPFSITFRPDSNRALVSFFQTGNFGVLDLERQTLFPNPFIQSTDGRLTGLVAVTPALHLDSHLWPSRGAYSFGSISVPSPDEALLYPTAIEYAQNGRFAVAVHGGARPPGAISAPLPDFVNDTAARESLREIGFTIPDDGIGATDPDGNPVSSFDEYVFDRGGGALSIVHDDPITADLAANANRVVMTESGVSRPYYSSTPVCAVPNADSPTCATDVSNHVFAYRPSPGTTKRFDQPHGVAIQPFVAVSTPAFGDQVGRGTMVGFNWRDSRVFRFRARLYDLGSPGQTASQTQVTTVNKVLSAKQIAARNAAFPFSFFLNGEQPQSGHRYRIEIAVMTAFDDVVSLVTHDVRLR